MELTSIELQVFVSLTVILGAGLIALIVDYLKGSNEQLRERNIELSVRREEENRRSIGEIRLLRERMLAAAAAPPQETEQTPEPAAAVEAATASAPPEPEAARSTQAVIERAVERAVRHAVAEKPEVRPWRLEVVGRKSAVEPKVEVAGPAPAAEQGRPPNSLLDHIIFASMPDQSVPARKPAPPPEPPVERIVLVAAPAKPAQLVLITPLQEPRAPELATEPPVERIVLAAAPDKAVEPAQVVMGTSLQEPRAPEPATEPLVERIELVAAPAKAVEPAQGVLVTPLEEPRAAEPPAAGFLEQEIAPKTCGAVGGAAVAGPTPAPVMPERRIAIRSGLAVRREPVRRRGPEIVRPATELPKGFFGPAEIAALVGDSQPVTGVVVAIGIKDRQQMQISPSHGGALDLVDSVDRLIRSMISANDFAYRRSADEFIVIFPDETGAAAKRRMNQVAERLWDFQLRSLASFSALFSWGAAAVVNQSFADAVELADDEMSETRLSRRSMGMDNLRAHRRAANS